MALRFSTRRLSTALRTPRFTVNLCPSVRYASSSVTAKLKESVAPHSDVPCPDPPADSKTASLVNDQLPYMVPTYARPPPMFERGKGCYLYDVEGRSYLDFTAGIAVNALGHCDPGMAEILAEQSKILIHTSNLYHNPHTGRLSKQLIELTKATGGMSTASRAFICNSGSEANEAAIKFARKVGKSVSSNPDKYEIVSFHNSFHGRTMGSLSATPNPKYQAPFSPMVPGFRYGDFNDVAAVPDLITPNTCGVILEPIQGEGGVNVATPEFLQAVRARCTEVGAVLIYDEIQCGLSRTGTFWAHAAYPVETHPDILTTAKALGNGFPIGATIVNDFVCQHIKVGDHGTTFGGNPLACRVASYNLEKLSGDSILGNVPIGEEQIRVETKEFAKRWPDKVGEMRGKGLILGLQLKVDPTPVVMAARERGLLIITCGKDTLRFVPPLVISEFDISWGMATLKDAMETVWGKGNPIQPGMVPQAAR